MTHINYLKCKDGVPVQPLKRTLVRKLMPKEAGVTWVEFDSEAIRPVDIKDTLVDGKVVKDQAKADAFDAEQANLAAREVARRAVMERLVDAELGL